MKKYLWIVLVIIIFLVLIIVSTSFKHIEVNGTISLNSDKRFHSSSTDISFDNKQDDIQPLSKLLFKVETVPSPKGLAFSPDGKEIWVTSLLNKKRGAAVFDARTGNLISNISLNNNGGVEVIFNRNGSKAYISQMETASVFEVDAKTKNILRVFKTNSSWTKVIALSFDEKRLYASNWSGNNVSEFDLENGKLVRNIKTVKTPRSIYPTKDNSYLYVAGYDKGELQKIDLKNEVGEILYDQGSALRHIVVDEKKNIMYISDMGKNNILKLDLTNDAISIFAKTDENPNTIALSPEGNLLFVSCRGQNYSADDYSRPGPEWGTVLIFDTHSGKLVDAIIGGNQPTALGVSPDGKILVFSDFLDGILEFYQIPDYNILKNNQSSWLKNYKNSIKKTNF